MPVGRTDRSLLDTRVDEEALLSARRDTGNKVVQLAYPRKGVWSGNNQLGVELPFQIDANLEQTVFKMDEWGFPQIWTIALSVFVPDLKVGQFFDVIGEISYGSGGVVQTFDVDWVDGTVFSLPMNAINVRAKWSELATIGGIFPPPGVRISVIASRGSIRHARATKTQFFGEIAAGATVQNTFVAPPVFPGIPTFAKSVVVTASTAAGAALLYAASTELWFLGNDNTGVPAVLQVVPGNMLGPTTSFKVPIPANARYWTIFNGAGVPIPLGPALNAGSLIWNLFDE